MKKYIWIVVLMSLSVGSSIAQLVEGDIINVFGRTVGGDNHVERTGGDGAIWNQIDSNDFLPGDHVITTANGDDDGVTATFSNYASAFLLQASLANLQNVSWLAGSATQLDYANIAENGAPITVTIGNLNTALSYDVYVMVGAKNSTAANDQTVTVNGSLSDSGNSENYAAFTELDSGTPGEMVWLGVSGASGSITFNVVAGDGTGTVSSPIIHIVAVSGVTLERGSLFVIH